MGWIATASDRLDSLATNSLLAVQYAGYAQVLQPCKLIMFIDRFPSCKPPSNTMPSFAAIPFRYRIVGGGGNTMI